MTSGELSESSFVPRSANSICWDQRASASARCKSRDVHPATLPELVLDLIGEKVYFGFRTFHADDEVWRVIADFGLGIADCSGNIPTGAGKVVDCRGWGGKVDKPIEQDIGGCEVGAGGDDRGGRFRPRFQFEGELRDDGERAERAAQQLAEVVAGDVFHDAAAALERDCRGRRRRECR